MSDRKFIPGLGLLVVLLLLTRPDRSCQTEFERFVLEVQPSFNNSLDKMADLVEMAFNEHLTESADVVVDYFKSYPKISALVSEVLVSLEKVVNASGRYVDQYSDSVINKTVDVADLEMEESKLTSAAKVGEGIINSINSQINTLHRTLTDERRQLNENKVLQHEQRALRESLKKQYLWSIADAVISFGILSFIPIQLKANMRAIDEHIRKLEEEAKQIMSRISQTESQIVGKKTEKKNTTDEVERKRELVSELLEKIRNSRMAQNATVESGDQIKMSNTLLKTLHCQFSVLYLTSEEESHVILDLLIASLERLYQFLAENIDQVRQLAGSSLANEIEEIRDIFTREYSIGVSPSGVGERIAELATHGSLKEKMTNISNVYGILTPHLAKLTWEPTLLSIPKATAILGGLMLASSSGDWPLRSPSQRFTHVKRPTSFRATLLQMSNVLYTTMLHWDIWMTELETRMQIASMEMDRLVRFMKSDRHGKLLAQFPSVLNAFLVMTTVRTETTTRAHEAVETLLNLTREVIESTSDRGTAEELRNLVAVWTDLRNSMHQLNIVVKDAAALEFLEFTHQLERLLLTKRSGIKMCPRIVLLSDRLNKQTDRANQAAYVLQQMAHSFSYTARHFLMPQVMELEKFMTLHRQSVNMTLEEK